MTFNTVQYGLFLVVAVAGHWMVPRRFRNVWLLAASYAFYASFDARFALLLAATTAVTWWTARRATDGVDRALAPDPTSTAGPPPGLRTGWLWVAIAWNVATLCVFKYFNFFADSAVELANSLGLSLSQVDLQLLLPVGISFYTFQAIAYSVSVRRGRVTGRAAPVDFAAYLAFFPSILAGPIEKPWRLLDQVAGERTRPDRARVARALALVLMGLAKKVVVADTAATVANLVYAEPSRMHWTALVAGSLAFAVQLYFDFSGYIDIARGSALLFGVDLMENFREPYLARRPSEFWRCWNISLSEWLRDYVYIPLGGNRRGRAAESRNLMATMLVGGLWHGAAWTFVAWGGYWGGLLVLDRYLPGRRRPAERVGWRDAPAVLAMFGAVTLGWILFRAASFGDAAEVVWGILTLQGGRMPIDAVLVPPLLLLTAAYSIARRGQRDGRWELTHRPALAGALAGACVAGIVVFSGAPAVQFVYLQF
jgi:D-alanyl-lipoteichoic acid acyltransferase DltB (MBOAT superfamily)